MRYYENQRYELQLADKPIRLCDGGITSVRSTPEKDISIDTSKMSEEEIMKLPPDVYKKLFMKK